MINFIDEKGARHGVIAEITERKAVNGEKSLSGTVYLNDEVIHGIDRGWKVEFNNEFYVVTYALPVDNGKTVELEFDAVHEFFYDFSKSVVYSELNGSNTMKRYLDFIFDGSGYSYRLEVDISAFEKESFGMENRLSLFNDVVKSTGVEFSVNGRVVRILKEVGTDLSTIVKKGFNMQEIKLEKNINDFVTYKKGYGAWFDDDDHSKGRLEVEYESPLSSVYGRLHADPIDDERFSVKRSLLDRVKNDVESSYTVSIQLTMEDLTKAGYDYDHPYEGDYIMAINDDLGFKKRIRIVSYESFYDAKGQLIDHQVTCNSIGLVDKLDANSAGIRNTVNQALKEAQTAVSIANSAAVSADGKHMNYYGPTEPSLIGYKIRYGDMWYQTVGEETVMNYWNGAEWFPIFNTGKLTEISKEVTAAIKQADIDREKSEQDFETAKSEAKAYTEQKANEFNNQMEIVRADVADTELKANNAVAKANQSIADVGFMQIDLNATKQNAIDALTKAQTATDNLNTLSFNVDELTKTVSFKAEKTTVDAVTKQVDQHELSIAANAREIDLRMTSTQVDSLVSAKGYVNQAQLTATSEKWNLSLTQVSSDLEGLEIGGRNFFTKAHSFSQTVTNGNFISRPADTPNGFYVVGNSSSNGQVRLDKVITENGWWTVSFDIKGTQSLEVGMTIDICDLGATRVLTNKTNSYRRVSVSVYVTNYSSTVYNFVDFGKIGYAVFNVDNIKVEKGNKATDWTPAPEDMVTLEQFTTIDATVKGLQTTVGNKADTTQVTQLATQWTQTTNLANSHTGQISNLGEQINLRVTSGQVTAAILADKSIKDTRNDNQLPSWYFNNYPRQIVKEFKTRTSMGLPGSQYYSLVTTEVPYPSNDNGNISIVQTAESKDGTFKRSSITTTTWTAWEKTAEVGNLVAQINLSPKGVLIQGKNIQLDGDVSMNAAFITRLDTQTLNAVTANIATIRTKMLTADVILSTMIKSDTALVTKIFATDANVSILTAKAAFINSVKAIDIAADRITTGTLNAAKIKVIGLDAGSITSGTLNSIDITGTKITNNFSISSEGATLNGTTVIAGDYRMNYTVAQTGQTGNMLITPLALSSQILTKAGSLVSSWEISSTGLRVSTSGLATAYTASGFTFYPSGSGIPATVQYIPGNARIAISSYNGVELGAVVGRQHSARLAVGGGNDGVAPFVDMRAKTTVYDNSFTVYGDVEVRTDGTPHRTILRDVGGNGWLAGRWSVKLGVLGENNNTAYEKVRIENGATSFFHDINMNGNKVQNQSDIRLKNIIGPTNVRALDLIKSYTFVDFTWKDSKKPMGIQTGLIAQNTAYLSSVGNDGYYQIDSSQQIMLNSQAIQELNYLVDLKFSEHELRIKELEEKIKQLESAA